MAKIKSVIHLFSFDDSGEPNRMDLHIKPTERVVPTHRPVLKTGRPKQQAVTQDTAGPAPQATATPPLAAVASTTAEVEQPGSQQGDEDMADQTPIPDAGFKPTKAEIESRL